MKLVKVFLVFLVAGMLFACGGKTSKVDERKVELSEKYEKCMKKAGDDQAKQAECEQYLKATEPLK